MGSVGSPEEPSWDVPCFVSGGRATRPSPEPAVLTVSQHNATREVELIYSTGYHNVPV